MNRIIRSFLGFFFLCIFTCQPAVAVEQPSAEDVHFNEWMTYYYVYKNPAPMARFLAWMQKSQVLEKHEGAVPPFAAFLSVVFADNPAKIKKWIEPTKFTGKSKIAVEFALWLSGHSALIRERFHGMPDYAKSTPQALLEISLKKPSDLDMLWGAFLGSGNVAYVERIIDLLDETKPLTGHKTADTATRAAAKAALAANAMQHEVVNRVILADITKRPAAVKEKLEDIVRRNAKKLKPFPNHDGDFSAMLAVIEASQLKEYSKPENDRVKPEEVSKAIRGEPLAIKILFSGIGLRDDLTADVTFDMKIRTPAGKLFGGVNIKKAEAIKGKIPLRFRVFDNHALVKLRFMSNDRPGKYKVEAEITDNVTGKKIQLSKQVELME